jgi:hypothetical protein
MKDGREQRRNGASSYEGMKLQAKKKGANEGRSDEEQ